MAENHMTASVVDPKDPYKVASEFGLTQGLQDAQFSGTVTEEQQKLLEKVAYWSAWRAARNAAAAFLNKAAELNVTVEQMQALTEVAEQVAYD